MAEETKKVSKPKKTPAKKAVKTKEKPALAKVGAEKEEASSVKPAREKKPKRYFEAVGRRKSAVARVRLFTIKPFEGDEGKITINDKFYKQYFSTLELQQIAEASLRRLKSLNRFEIVVKVKGGGVRSQAEALRHGIARTLVAFNIDFRKKLKKAGYLKRDPRVKERRKYGLKKARRAPQWQKR